MHVKPRVWHSMYMQLLCQSLETMVHTGTSCIQRQCKGRETTLEQALTS